MKILIIGGSGLLGRALMTCFKGETVYGTHFHHPSSHPQMMLLDITSKKDVEVVIHKIKPEVIVHTAALTGVEYCESHQQEAITTNVTGTQNLVCFSKRMNAKFVYISTDYVFDGEKGMYTEDDTTSPLNIYGETKLAGETVVEQESSDYLITRTSVLYGSPAGNFATWVIASLSQGKHITVVDDQYVTPTYRYDLAQQLKALIERDEHGIFHTAGADRINRYEFALKIADVFGFDRDMITPATMNQLTWVARRPRDSSLDTAKITRFKKPYKITPAVRKLKADMARNQSA